MILPIFYIFIKIIFSQIIAPFYDEIMNHVIFLSVTIVNWLNFFFTGMSAGTDIIMLDNMTPDRTKKAVDLIRRRKPDILIEASGNMNLENVRKIAETGVDLISVGAVTHSAAAADISMRFEFL